MRLIPFLNRQLEKGPRRDGMITYKWKDGLPFVNDSFGGLSLPQVYCCPLSASSKVSGVIFTDEAIFQRSKIGMFQLIILLEDLVDLEATRKSLLGVEDLSNRYLLAGEATFIVQVPSVRDVPANIGNDVFRIATADEFAATEYLCKNRPVPQYYDMYQMKRDLRGKKFAIVRPDRFIYAACDTVDQVYEICGRMQQNLGLQ